MPNEHVASIDEFFANLRAPLRSSLESLIAEHHGLKMWLGLDIQYRHMFEERTQIGHLTTHTAVIHNDFQIDEVLDRLGEELTMRNANYLRNASPLALDSVESAVAHIARYAPTVGGTYLDLPDFLARKKCIVNVKNNDNRCFGYSLLASLIQMKGSRNRPDPYNQHFKSFHLDEIEYPVEPNKVPEIEEKLRIKISIFSFFDDEGQGRFPLYVSEKDYGIKIDLLYWRGHFALITNFERFLADITRSKVKKYFCRQCFGHFKGQAALERHQLFCNRPNFSNSIYTLPPPDSTIKFNNVR